MKILRNSNKLNGTGIYVSEDCDKEDQQIRKEIIQMRIKYRNAGQSCKLRRNELVINDKFINYKELVNNKATH